MYQNPGNNNALAGGGGGGATTSNPNASNMDSMQQQQQQNLNYNGMQQQQQQQQQQATNANKNMRKKPYVKITEQPAGKALRFRYECEGRSAGSIPGVNSTPENKTYPTIEIVGYKGRAVVVVSCVTKDQPYRPHPHNLVGKEGCKKGVCTLEINSETMRAVFSNLGIQCVKKKDIEAALKAREEIRVDPFKTGFAHRFQPSSIDLNSVRLCFQVFMESDQKGRFTQPLPPVVSEPIYDKKAMSDLVICRLCSCSATVLGNTQIILLCEKVAKEDIAVRFYEEKNNQLVWEAYGEFQHTDVHKQTAIAFKTPRYHTIDITEPAKVFIQLKRPSDGVTSEPLPFEYVPLDSGRKRFLDLRRNLKRKPDYDIFQEILGVDHSIESSEKQQIPTPAVEVIDLNTPTNEQQQPENQTIVSETTQPTLTNDPNERIDNDDEEESKRRDQQEIDTIIDEKMRELEQQQQQEQLSAMQQVVEIINTQETQPEQITPVAEPTPQLNANEKITEWIQSNEMQQGEGGATNASESEDKTLSDLLEQVAELDEIYSEHVVRRDTYNNTLLKELNGIDACVPEQNTGLVDGGQTAMDVDDSFDDAATYSSLQIAFKNPITIPMEDIMPPTPPASVQTDIGECGNYDPIEVRSSSTAVVTPDIVQQSQTQTPPRPAPPKPVSPHMHITAVEEEKLPPLPPKRLRKQDSNAENRSIEANIGDAERKSRQQAPILITKPTDQVPPTKRLPQKPGSSNTLPRQKKPGFFSKLFSRRKSKSDLSQAGDLETVSARATSKATSPEASREPSISYFDLKDTHRSSLRSAKSLQPPSFPSSPSKGGQKIGKPVARSVSSVSGKRRLLYHSNADIIHIPLKGELYPDEEYSHASTITLANTLDQNTVSALEQAQIPITDGNMELVAIADREGLRNLTEGQFNVELDPSMDLTEAEHYALYTTMPPKATASEFDEASAYYAPVDAGEILTPEEVAQRLLAANHPTHLRRKRQKTNGDPVHLLLQQQQKQHQNDHADARQGNMACWNPLNIPAIKTEPRDTSPQPFGMYRAPPELTPSPQPLSPNGAYNHNTPSPYSIASTTAGTQGNNQQLISPNQQQYNPGNGGPTANSGAGGGNVNRNGPPQMDMNDYNTFGQQTQPQYHGNNFGGAGATHWESKYNPTANTNNNNLGNLNSTTAFNMPNLLTAASGAGGPGNGTPGAQGPGGGGGPGGGWNLPPNHFQHQHHLQQQQQQHQQYQQHQTNTNDPVANTVATSNNNKNNNTNNNNNGNNNTNNNTEHGLSNLLNFDSEQLVRINSEDQQMLRLNSEDLQLSNLSIST